MTKDDEILLKIYDLLDAGERQEAFDFFFEAKKEDALSHANRLQFDKSVHQSERQSAAHEGIANTFVEIEKGNVPSNLDSYLHAVIKNDLSKTVSKRNRSLRLPFLQKKKTYSLDHIFLLLDLPDDKNNRRIFIVRKAMKELDPECQQRIKLIKVDGLSHKDLLKKMPSTGTVERSRDKLRYCMKKLKRKINKL